jgi:nucleoside-triphosphatase
MDKRMLLLTGDPGVGKTTVLMKVIGRLRERGISIGGIISREVRERGRRVGFEMIDIASGARETLASIYGEGARMGRYKVNLKGLAEFAANALISAISDYDVVVCDEVGPMELLSPEFRRAVGKIIGTDKPALLVIHKRMKDPLLRALRYNRDAEMIEVTEENREELDERIYEKVLRLLGEG